MIKDDILKSFDRKNALVTGGTGLIGRQVVDILCAAGARVTSCSLDKIEVNPKVRYLYADLSDFNLCKKITKDMDFVFHVAGIKGSIEVTKKKPASFFVPLLMMNTNVLEAARLNKVKKTVYTSSIGAYASAEVFKETENLEGPPMDTFPGWAKRMAELQVEAYRVQYGLDNIAVVRLCNVYGPGDNFDPANAMVIPSLMGRIRAKEDPVRIWGDGSAIREFAFSRDVAEGIILALYHGTGGGFMNLGSGREHTIRQLVEALNSFIDFNYEFDVSKPSGFPRRVTDIALARQRLGYEPSTPLVDGLKETWAWFLENTDEHLRRQNYFTPHPEDPVR